MIASHRVFLPPVEAAAVLGRNKADSEIDNLSTWGGDTSYARMRDAAPADEREAIETAHRAAYDARWACFPERVAHAVAAGTYYRIDDIRVGQR